MSHLHSSVTYWKTLGLKLKELDEGSAIFEINVWDGLTWETSPDKKIVHGGVLASMLDSCCACAAATVSIPDSLVATIDLQVAYHRVASGGRLVGKGTVKSAGKRVIFCEAEIQDEKGQIIASGTSQLLRIPTGDN